MKQHVKETNLWKNKDTFEKRIFQIQMRKFEKKLEKNHYQCRGKTCLGGEAPFLLKNEFTNSIMISWLYKC